MECVGDGRCLSECECLYLKGTNDCSCLGYEHGHLKNNLSFRCLHLWMFGPLMIGQLFFIVTAITAVTIHFHFLGRIFVL